ncbi:MAG: phosphate/phosphite/phosphonate ABC transporter substrate-binding protein [Myxococcota bacterium]
MRTELNLYRTFLTFSVVLLVCCKGAPEPSTPSEPAKEQTDPGVTLTPLPEKALRLSVTPIAAKTVLEREFEPLARYLSSALEVPVTLEIPESYSDATDRVVRGEVDVAFLSPLAYVLSAKRSTGLTVIATPIAQGAPTYASYILVREDAPMTELEQLKGKSIAFVDRRSTSGFLYPYAYLLDRGIEPDSYFGSVSFLGDHGSVVEALRSGRVDAGATFAAAAGFVEGAAKTDLRILAKTGRIPYDAVVVVESVSDAAKTRLREAFLALSTRTESGRQILRSSSGINGFLAADDSHYDEIRRVLDRVGPRVAIP